MWEPNGDYMLIILRISFRARHKMFAKSLASQNFLVRDVHFSPIFRLKTLEQFSTGWRELKPKKPQQPIRRKVDITINQWELKVTTACFKREKTRVTRLALVTVLYLIGRDGGVSFQDQSQSEVKQNKRNPGSILIWKQLILAESDTHSPCQSWLYYISVIIHLTTWLVYLPVISTGQTRDFSGVCSNQR